VDHRLASRGRSGVAVRVLVVEDDPLLGDGLTAGLRQRGFDVDWMRDGIAAELALRGEPYAAVVLDLGLPRLDGLELLRRQRAKGSRAPILVLTARDAVDLDELAARLRALIRRSRGEPAPVLALGTLRLDPAARTVTLEGRPVDLQAKEFNLLHEFMLHADRVLTRSEIENRLYAYGEEIESNAVEVHVHHLRKKLAPDLIRTVRGVGYVMPRTHE